MSSVAWWLCFVIIIYGLLQNAHSQFINTDVTEACETFVPETAETSTFLYTDSYKPCPDTEFATVFQLNCTAASLVSDYLRVAFRTPVAPVNQSYISFQTFIENVASSSTNCLGAAQSCATTPCDTLLAPLAVGVIASRAYVKYGLTFQRNIPYSFFPVDVNAANPSSVCTALANCTCAEIDPTDTSPCTITDTLNIAANCGNNTDPNQGFSSTLNTLCTTVCCQACNASSASYHRRWAVNPVCSLYTISEPQLVTDVYVAVAEKLATGLQGYVEAKDSGVSQTFVGTNINVNYTIQGNVVRLYVNKAYTGLQSSVPLLSGMFVLCDYGNLTQGMGPVNPYVTLNPPFNVTFNDKVFTIDNGRYRTPGINSSPATLGAGKVPTQNSVGLGVSMFYLNESIAGTFAATFGIDGYIQTQKDVLQNYQAEPNNVTNINNYQPPSWWDAYNGLPGWETTGGVPISPSPCQMASDVNSYAQRFLDALAGNGGNYTAALAAAGPPSPYLPPTYGLLNPNWWPGNDVNNGQTIYLDITTVVKPTQPTNEYFVDIIGTVLDGTVNTDIVQISDKSACVTNLTMGVGTALAYVVNPEPAQGKQAAFVNLYLSCNYTLTDSSGNTTVHAVTISPSVQTNIAAVPDSIQPSAPFTMTFSNQTKAAPTCVFTAVDTLTNITYPGAVFSCVVPLNPLDAYLNFINTPGANQSIAGPPTSCASSCDISCLIEKGEATSSGCFWGIMAACVAALIVIFGITACIVSVCCNSKSKSQTKTTKVE
jgi:hypothetical protein